MSPIPGIMRRMSSVLWIPLLLVSAFAHAAGATNQHTFACTDYTQGKVLMFAKDGKREWEFQTTGCNDLWVLPNGNLLFNTGHGVREVTREKKSCSISNRRARSTRASG